MMEKQQPGPHPSSSRSQCTPGWTHTQCRTRGVPPLVHKAPSLAHKALPGAVCTMKDAQQHPLPETSPGARTGLPYPTVGTRWCSAQIRTQSLICVTEWALNKYLQRALCRRLVPAVQRSSTFFCIFFTGLDCLICETHPVFTVILKRYPGTLDFAVLDKYHYSS